MPRKLAVLSMPVTAHRRFTPGGQVDSPIRAAANAADEADLLPLQQARHHSRLGGCANAPAEQGKQVIQHCCFCQPTCTAQRCTMADRCTLAEPRALLLCSVRADGRVARRVEMKESSGSLSRECALRQNRRNGRSH